MSISTDTLTNIIVGFFTLLVVGASVFAILRSSVLKQNNKDLTDRVTILEADKVRNEATIKAHEAKISALETVVTGRDLLQQLIEIGNRNEGKLDRLLDHRPRP